MQWKENATVQVASNRYGVAPTKDAKRYSSAAKKFISVQMPYSVDLRKRSNGWRHLELSCKTVLASLSPSAVSIFCLCLASSSNADEETETTISKNSLQKPLDYFGFIRNVAITYLLLNTKKKQLWAD
ncbi:hypothetical protein HHI36_009784 [Cryptolaemus montrouzieri]|uniref:Uncharacterized protein n=1 Tax=Cryptolaemus montrouzieri TaxID=559131 RepID=A0ABD2MGU6_9CUCU